jgi:hypothetical protein
MITGKCGFCGRHPDEIKMEYIRIGMIRGVTYSCPHCHAILNVGPDPVSLQADLASQVAKEVTKALARRG